MGDRRVSSNTHPSKRDKVAAVLWVATAAAAAAAACAAITVTCMGVRLDEAAAALALRGASGSFRPVAAAAARGKAKRVGGRSRGLAEAAAPILHNDKRSVEALDGSLLENAETVHRDMSAEILARWGAEYEHTTLFTGGMRFSDGGKVVEDKMLNAIVEQGGFVAAFTGISTTAGHDCLYEESYPIVLDGAMGRLMAAAGVRFKAINVAMGHTHPSPYSFCVDAHAGLEADIISWDMSMMVADRTCGPAASSIELFIRSAAALPRHPAVLIMDASPDAETCGMPTKDAWHDKRNYALFTGDCDPDRSLMKVYRDFGLHQMAPSSLIPSVTCGDARFSREKLFNAEEKTYPKPAKWHPGPTGHLLLADMLFMHYAAVFLSALHRLDQVAPGITATQLRQKDATSRSSLEAALGLKKSEGTIARRGGDGANDEDRTDEAYMGGGRGGILPPPAWCKGWRFCDDAGEYRCASTYYPLAGMEGSRLVDMVSERTPAVVNLDHAEYVVQPKEGHWAVALNEEALPVIDYLSVPPPEGKHKPIDMKWTLVGDSLSGPIDFEFETIGLPPGNRRAQGIGEATEQGEGGVQDWHTAGTDTTETVRTETFLGEDSRVVVCRPDFINHVYLGKAADVSFRVDGVQVSVSPMEHRGLNKNTCVVLDVEVGVGRHTLTVEPLQRGRPFVAISHVLYPA